LLGLTGLGTLSAVFRAALLAILYARGVQRAAHDVVTHSRQILHAAATYQNDRVFLQIVANTRNVGSDFDRIRQPHTRNFAQRGVRLLGSLRVHTNANTALLGAAHQRRRLGFNLDLLAAHTY